MSSSEQPRTPSPAPAQETSDVKADRTSEAEVSSAVERLATVKPDASFFEDHLKACPLSVVKRIEKRKDVHIWVAEICRVKSRELDLYQPVASLLSEISEKVFKYLQNTKDKGRLHLPKRRIMFLDHHTHVPTHFPVGRVDDKPDIIGATGREHGYQIADDGTYEGVPYHCIETVVEAKAIYGPDGQAQATRYAFNIQQARPDRPGFYCLSISPGKFQVIYSSPLGVLASEHKPWSDFQSLCAYVYSLYDPPDGHVLYDRTITPIEPCTQPLGKPTWTIKTQDETYSGASIIFLGDPWARRTTVFRIKKGDRGSVVIKESYFDCKRRFEEAELLTRIHEHGFLPGVVRYISAEDVKNGEDPIILTAKDGSMKKRKRRIVLADIGYDLTLAKSVNDLLKAIYDALEVHRTLARDRRVLHRDMSIFNLLMYPTLARCPQGRYSQNFPPLIDDILDGALRTPGQRKARCLIIDLDNAASLVEAQANVIPEELRCRTGTPAYIARNVAGGALYTSRATLSWPLKMPQLSDTAKDLYVKAYGEARYRRYNDSANTVHGGVPPEETVFETMERADGMPFYHRWEYDAESVFWTMYSALLRVVPLASPEETAESRLLLNQNWKRLYEHTIPETRDEDDSRNPLLDQKLSKVVRTFLPEMHKVGKLVYQIANHVFPSYAVMTPPPPHDDHLHEAMQRLILEYLVENRDNPIPLMQGSLRPVETGDSPVVNRGIYGETIMDSRGEKRRLDPDAPQPVRRLTRSSASIHDEPTVIKDGFNPPFQFLEQVNE
ncbi:hypothetical protein BN946_scf184499.g18 [Trametes cinnabarina]|uniref:Fungal-type protein kinase domain-containing protein n=1 Tax=Pycnoporus cinnabarinus TaxID=5643 RepID=A0A060S7X1_PYCCI|nr:hypothetical protein BN946_scf184499.g18 [Trametes cinnabarina]